MKASDQTLPKNEAQFQSRKTHMQFRCSEIEKKEIEENARKAGLLPSDFLRLIGRGFNPMASIDLERVDDLLRINGDLGRLGGLLKLWLTKDGVRKKFGSDYISALLVKIEETQGEMLLLLKDIRRKHSK